MSSEENCDSIEVMQVENEQGHTKNNCKFQFKSKSFSVKNSAKYETFQCLCCGAMFFCIKLH